MSSSIEKFDYAMLSGMVTLGLSCVGGLSYLVYKIWRLCAKCKINKELQKPVSNIFIDLERRITDGIHLPEPV